MFAIGTIQHNLDEQGRRKRIGCLLLALSVNFESGPRNWTWYFDEIGILTQIFAYEPKLGAYGP